MSKSGKRGGRRYLPFVFTEHGVAMLSSVLRSERAVQVNIAVMRAFVKLREVLSTHKDVRTVNEHIKNIFKEKELTEKSVIRKFRITARDGKTYDTAHYNLDVIISVGYRVKSKRGTQFRQWATRVLCDHLVRRNLWGLVLNI